MSTFTNTAREVEMPNGDIVKLHDGVTPNSTSNIKKFKYDDNGHVTESTAADAEDLNLSGYSTPTTGSTAIGTSDDVQTAIGKLDHQSHIDQTNILLVEQMNGAKNIVDLDASTVKMVNASGLTFTIQKGTITINGTSNGVAYIGIPFSIKAGQWFVSGCPSGGGSTTYLDDIRTSTGGDLYVSINDTGSGFMFTVPTDTTLFYDIRIASNYTANNLVFKPMIISKAAYDAGFTDYQPFARPNYDLTQLQSEDRAALIQQIDTGAKNLWNITLDSLKSLNSSGYTWNNRTATHTATGITFTVNLDMTITANGTVGASNLVFNYGEISAEYNGCMLSNTPDTSTKYRTVVDNVGYDTGNGILLTNTVARNVKIELISNSSISNVTFKPLICTLADWKISQNFAPHALPNTVLTQLEAEDRAALAEVVDSGAKQLACGEDNSGTGGTATIQSDGYTVKLTGSASSTLSFTKPILISETGTYTVAIEASGTFDTVAVWDSTASTNVTMFTATGSANVTLTAGHSYLLYHYTASAMTLNATVKFLVCTKAAFDVSPAYAPYRKNLDELEATKAPMLSGSITSGDLNDVTINTFAMYANTVSSLPTSDNYYVETSVFDASSLLQRAYNIATAESYVRVKCVGTWSAWKQITNA